MDARAISAASAYANALGRAKTAPKAAEGDGLGGQAGGFAEMVKQAAGDVAGTTRTAEKMALAGVAKQAELVDVVTAVTNAEMTLETVVAVRDKVINAYQEIMRMSI